MKNDGGSYDKGPVIYRNTLEGIQNLPMEMKAYEQQQNHLSEILYRVASEADMLRRLYEDVIEEKSHIEQAAAKAEEELQHVRQIIGRYTAVKDAVVASDGYTYERSIMEEYIKSCIDGDTTPVSQQTNQEISSCLYPNRSLKTLLERLVELESNDTANVKSNAEGSKNVERDSQVELNAKGERVHPCIRVYGFCNYSSNCSYANYPYEACLSNLKGKCRFRHQCHERHVDFRGPSTLTESLCKRKTTSPLRERRRNKKRAPKTKVAKRRFCLSFVLSTFPRSHFTIFLVTASDL